jgi:butyrate kinase
MPRADFRVLAVNPGSTSSKAAVFFGDQQEQEWKIRYTEADLAPFRGRPILDQFKFRLRKLHEVIGSAGYSPRSFDAVAGRGASIGPVAGGTYAVNDAMLEELRDAPRLEHASNLGAFLARAIADEAGVGAFIVDPVSVEERPACARLSGLAILERQSQWHALNSRAVIRRYARERNTTYEQLRLVVANMGSGISVSAHAGGRMLDVADPGNEGPFSGERAGALPTRELVRLCFRGEYTKQQIYAMLQSEGGLYSYLGTKDIAEVESRIDAGDARAALVFEAMVWQIVKEIGAMAALLDGRVDAVLVTGGMAHSERLADAIRSRVAWIAPVTVFPGEDELRALAEGVLRVLRGEETVREYRRIPHAAY